MQRLVWIVCALLLGVNAGAMDDAAVRLESTSVQNGWKRRIVHVSDGKKIYREHSVLDDAGKVTSIQVQSSDQAEALKLGQIPRNEMLAEVLRATQTFDFYAIADEFLGPKSVEVLKGVERSARSVPVEQAMTHLRLTVRPKDNLLIRSEQKSPQGSHDIQYKNIKLNEAIDVSVFEYKAPDGVPVQDLSAGKKE